MPSNVARRKSRAPVARWLELTIVVIVLSGIALTAWIWFPASHPMPIAASPAASDPYSGSIILSAPNQDTCRRYKLDNATGKMTDGRVTDCTVDADGDNGHQTRIGVIADGFRNK